MFCRPVVRMAVLASDAARPVIAVMQRYFLVGSVCTVLNQRGMPSC